jgi:hypothetical protein
MTVVVDKELCLTAEVKDGFVSTVEVLGLATYSNRESTVLSYASIFESLWIQAELKDKTKEGSKLRMGVIAITLNLINFFSMEVVIEIL